MVWKYCELRTFCARRLILLVILGAQYECRLRILHRIEADQRPIPISAPAVTPQSRSDLIPLPAQHGPRRTGSGSDGATTENHGFAALRCWKMLMLANVSLDEE